MLRNHFPIQNDGTIKRAHNVPGMVPAYCKVALASSRDNGHDGKLNRGLHIRGNRILNRQPCSTCQRKENEQNENGVDLERRKVHVILFRSQRRTKGEHRSSGNRNQPTRNEKPPRTDPSLAPRRNRKARYIDSMARCNHHEIEMIPPGGFIQQGRPRSLRQATN